MLYFVNIFTSNIYKKDNYGIVFEPKITGS
jgi:hypothetical protein